MTVLVAVILVNVVVSLFGFRALRDGAAQGAQSYLFIPHQVARGENGRGMLLAHFAHGGFAHLAFNISRSTRSAGRCSPVSARPSSC